MITTPQAWGSDFHVHSRVSYDTDDDCTPEAIAAVGAGLGMREIGLADHIQACSVGAPGYGGERDEEGLHADLAREVRDGEYPLRLLVGWEVDYFDTGRYSFDPDRHLEGLDYVLLGHHFMGHVAGGTPAELARYLIRIYLEMAEEPYAHIVAHPFYCSPPERHSAVMELIPDSAFAEFYSSLREHGKAAEISSYQFSAAHRDVEQNRRMYAVARENGVSFVLDSDSHGLSQIGDGLRCLRVLAELGFSGEEFCDYAKVMALRPRL